MTDTTAPTSARGLNRWRAKQILQQLRAEHATAVAPLALTIRPASTQAPAQTALAIEDHSTIPHADSPHPPPDLRDPECLLERCVIVEPRLATVFCAAMIAAGASQTGERTLRVPVSEPAPGAINPTLRRVLDILPADILYTPDSWQAQHRPAARRRALQRELGRLPTRFTPPAPAIGEHPDHGPPARSAILLSATPYGLYVKVITRPGGWLDADSPAHKWGADSIRDSATLAVHPDDAIEALLAAHADGLELVDPHGLAGDLEALVRSSTVARQIAAMPGLALLVDGRPDGPPIVRHTMTAALAAQRVAARQAAGGRTAIDDRVADAARMEDALPHLDGVLVGRQRDKVARILATSYGLLDASVVGSGKTVTAVRAMRAKAQTLPAFRALVVCAKALRSQWQAELCHPEHGFPEAHVLCCDARTLADEVARFDQASGSRAGVVVASYEQARLRTDDLRVLTYDVIVCDEAARLANPATQLSQALWRLRGRAKVALALTATPVGRSLEDLDAILAWVRDDHTLKRTRTLARRYGTLDATSMRRLRRAVGPALFRMTRADLAGHLPDVLPAKHQFLDPTAAEHEGAHALMHRMAELYAQLVAQIQAARAIAPEDPAVKEAVRALSSTHGHLRAVATIARMWAIDPESVSASRSQAAGLLRAQGLIEQAIDMGPTKRQVTADTVAAAVHSGERTLVFCEFASCLTLLARELHDRHGISAGLFTQGTPAAQREAHKRALHDGEIKALLIGPVGQEGHNMPADIVLHYDLPWTPTRLEQRTGRAARAFSDIASVHVLIPIVRHSIEERVAALLIPRAAAAHAALDQQDDGGGDSDVARQLGLLAGELADRDDGSLLMRIAASVLADTTAAGHRRR